MSAQICWCCQINLAWNEYDGDEYLGDKGEKPCYECVQEAEETPNIIRDLYDAGDE